MALKHRPKIANQLKKQRLDKVTIEIIEGINKLILKAQMEHCTAITTVLSDARETIAWWAAHDDYDESHADTLVSRLTGNGGLHAALTFLAKFSAIKDNAIREELLESMEQFKPMIRGF